MSGDNQFIDPYNTYVLITSSMKDPTGANIPAEVDDTHNPVCNMLPAMGWVPLGLMGVCILTEWT